MTTEEPEEPHPMEAHREVGLDADGTKIVEGVWLYEDTQRPATLREFEDKLPPWLRLNATNAAWLATELKAVSGIPDAWTFVPESPHNEDFRVERLALACPSNVFILRWTRVGFGKNKRWAWRLHGPRPPETVHGVLDMVERDWIHIWEHAMLLENGAGEVRIETTLRSQTAQSLWSKLANQDHPTVPDEHKGLIGAHD